MKKVKKGFRDKETWERSRPYESGGPPVIIMVEKFTGRVKFTVAGEIIN